MKRLYILLAVMVVMVGTLFATHEALAKVPTGTAGDDTLLGTDGKDRLDGRAGEDRLKGNRGNDCLWGSRGNDKIFPAKATTTYSPAPTVSTRATPTAWISSIAGLASTRSRSYTASTRA